MTASNPNNRLGRRSFLLSAGALAAMPLLGGAATRTPGKPGAADRQPAAGAIGRRRLGALEVSSLWRGPEAEIIPLCQELGIGFVPWSPLGVGLLTGAIDANTRFAQGDFRALESRFAPENLPHNMAVVELVKRWAERKRAAPAQIALAWLMAQKPWIVPIPGTTQMAHMLENIGAAQVRLTPAELAELNGAVAAVQIRGARLPEAVQVMSGVEAPPKR